MTLEAHHSARIKKDRTATQRIRHMTRQMGLCQDAYGGVLVACVQASALYGAEMVRRPGRDGVKNRHDELQRLENSSGEGGDWNVRTNNLGVVWQSRACTQPSAY